MQISYAFDCANQKKSLHAFFIKFFIAFSVQSPPERLHFKLESILLAVLTLQYNVAGFIGFC